MRRVLILLNNSQSPAHVVMIIINILTHKLHNLNRADWLLLYLSYNFFQQIFIDRWCPFTFTLYIIHLYIIEATYWKIYWFEIPNSHFQMANGKCKMRFKVVFKRSTNSLFLRFYLTSHLIDEDPLCILYVTELLQEK